jgi:hypothetical protein
MPKHFEREPETAIGLEAIATVGHKPKWSSMSWGIFAVLVAIFLAVVCPGILILVPFNPNINFCILVGFLLVVGLILWWQRYRVLMLIRWLEKRLGGKKTFH